MTRLRRSRGGSWRVALAAVVAFAFTEAGAAGAPNPISRRQQVEMLSEGLRCFDEAAELAASNPAAAKQRYEQAVKRLEALIASGIRNGRLYYNVGNAYLRLNRLGKAILSYRRAEGYIPGDDRLAENLRYARTLKKTQIQEAGRSLLLRSLLFWHFGTGVRGRAYAGAVAYVGTWLLLLVAVLTRRAWARWSSLVCALVFVALAVSVGADFWAQRYHPEGVVIADDVPVRKGNADGYELQFKTPLQQGVEFSLVERPRGVWYHIRLRDGRDGWIKKRSADLI